MRALLRVGTTCNNRCTFCNHGERREREDPSEVVERRVDRAVALGADEVIFTGGEPTIRRELPRWVRRASGAGLGVGLSTNGRMLCTPGFARHLRARGLGSVTVSLHGATAAVHDAIVGVEGAFEQALAGVRAARGVGIRVEVRCVITRTNLASLRDVVTLAAREGAAVTLAWVEPTGSALAAFDRVVPDARDAAISVRDALRESPAPASVTGLPHCLLAEHADRATDRRAQGILLSLDGDEAPITDGDRVHPPACDECAVRGLCPGLPRVYVARRGADELSPIPGPRSNSFTYVATRQLAGRPGPDCPLLREDHHHRTRTVLLRRGGRLRLYETRSRDFTDGEIGATVALGQLYADISDKAAPDDFARDLRKLVCAPECEVCQKKSVCSRCYDLLGDDVFSRDDAALRAILAGLRGDVLDVGCGEGRYLDAFAEAAIAGDLRYRGVDPDAECLRSLRMRWPWADLVAGRAEDLRPDPASVDHALLLRSYNHLERPRPVIEALVRALRPGGSLVVADNVAFGLLRDREHAARAEAGPARFEHYRNHDAGQARALIEGLPVRLIGRRDVGPRTSNQWVLHYERT